MKKMKDGKVLCLGGELDGTWIDPLPDNMPMIIRTMKNPIAAWTPYLSSDPLEISYNEEIYDKICLADFNGGRYHLYLNNKIGNPIEQLMKKYPKRRSRKKKY